MILGPKDFGPWEVTGEIPITSRSPKLQPAATTGASDERPSEVKLTLLKVHGRVRPGLRTRALRWLRDWFLNRVGFTCVL